MAVYLSDDRPRSELKIWEEARPRQPLGRSLVAIVLGATGIGFAPIFVRISDVGPSATGFWRLTLALPFILIWMLFSRGSEKKQSPPTAWFLICLAGVFFAGDLAIWHCSIRLTAVANATIETNLSAILVPLFAWLWLGQRIRGSFVVALFLAIVGVILLVGKNAHVSAQTLHGDFLGATSAFFYSGYLLSVKAARDRGSSTAIIMLVSGIMTSAGLYVVTLFSGEALLPATSHGWLVLLTLALVSQIGGQGLIAYALAGLPASFAAVGLLVQPATATVAAWLFLGESLAPAQFAGGVILAIGLWLARRHAT